RLLLKVTDARTRMWTMVADEDFVDTGWTTVSVDLSTGKNEFPDAPEPPLSIHAMWIELSDDSTGFVVDGGQLVWSELRAVGPDGSTVLDTAPMGSSNTLGVQVVPASEAADVRFSAMPDGQDRPSPAEIQASPLWREGEAVMWTLPARRSRANPLVPHVRVPPPVLKVLVDHEVGAFSGLNPGDVSSYTIGEDVIDGELVGYIDTMPTAVDTRREGLMVIDGVAYNAWVNGTPTWSLSGPLAALDAPGELWVETDEPDAVVRTVQAQMPDEPERVWTLAGTEASFSSRPVQVGLVAILFVGAAVGVVLALAGVTGYVLLAVSRRAREMGVLRALGFERTSVGITFALEQFVVIGLGAAIGALGGVALVMVMLPFLQLGETAAVIEPTILIRVPVPQLLGYISIVGVLLILSVLWATRRVSVRRMSEVLREVER
ncbi:MAG: ABC transporter permease, partial [Acidimicrobiia bacterium]|nr:ABC transporter permease [Acidimicrobiia bacterium]